MSSCQCAGYESQFGAEHAAKDLERYRTKGPDETTRILVDALKAAGVANASVLDIGAGVGVVQNELLSAGAQSAVHVDATAANIRAAEEESSRQGHRGRVTFMQGDFAALVDAIAPADVVTLDRVICCYPDMELLVGTSAAKARRLYGAVFPRERWLTRIVLALENVVRRLRGNPFRSYVHPVRAIEAAVERQGLTRRSLRDTFFWRVVVYSR